MSFDHPHRGPIGQAWRLHLNSKSDFYSGTVVVDARDAEVDEGWFRVVRLGDSTLASVPANSPHVDSITQSTFDLTDVGNLAQIIGAPDIVRGPAELLYFDASQAIVESDRKITELPSTHTSVQTIIEACDHEESDESGLSDVDSPIFAVMDGDLVVAACGWSTWPGDVAHFSVLTRPSHRSLGLGLAVTRAAISHAVAAGLLPQWRAKSSNAGSLALARRAGFEHVGRQLSVHA